MVEGPGATRNGRKIQVAVGCVVNSIDLPDESKRQSLQPLLRCGLVEAFTIGKELLLIFSTLDAHRPRNDNDDTVTSAAAAASSTSKENYDDVGNGNGEEVALRLHFGMNGCLYCGKKIDVPPWKQDKEASIRIVLVKRKSNARISHFHPRNFETDVLKSTDTDRIIVEARETTVSGIVSANAARAKLARLASKDACSASFDARQVFFALKEAGTNNTSLGICDAILNQDMYPGVGNIIKVEGLHRARVDPRRAVSSLGDDELRRVVLHCRRYAMGWLDRGKAPNKMVYNMTICGTCHTASVSMQKMGGGPVKASGSNHAYMSRTTFWCRICQPCSNSNNNNTNSSSGQAASTNEQQSQKSAALCLAIGCPEHGSCLLRRVRKADSPNLSRIFRICKVRQCQFFAWADSHLPSCRCGKKAILRVSKTARSGGRWFLACGSHGGKRLVPTNNTRSNHGCGLFEWAKPEILLPFGAELTPLL